MTYQRFEDLPVWQTAANLYESVEDLLQTAAFRATAAFRDQLDRSALSISNNLAEGFERGTTNELLNFLYIARGSAGEVRSMITLTLRRADKRRWSSDLKSQIISDFKSGSESSSSVVRRAFFINRLQVVNAQFSIHLIIYFKQKWLRTKPDFFTTSFEIQGHPVVGL